MLSLAIKEALNEQVNFEIYSAYLYIAMASWCDSQQLEGFGHWFKVQAQEEIMHALRIYNFIYERDGRVILKAISIPPSEWESILVCFKVVLKHENQVTILVNKLVALSRKEEDYATEVFLQWFIKEQVEEEATVKGLINKLILINKNEGVLFMLDRDMKKREINMSLDIKF